MKHFCSFAEAIREGAKLRPQTQIHLFDEVGTCAIGAGLHAMYGDQFKTQHGYDPFEFHVLMHYPYMLGLIDRCPQRTSMRWWQFWKRDICVWGERPHSLIDAIGHLNDHHKWTREEIADWLEKFEESIGYITITEEAEASSSSPAPEYVEV